MSRFDPQRAAELIAAARQDAGLTQFELAKRSGITQSNLSTMEGGRRRPSAAMLERILEAADYRPSIAVAHASGAIHAAATRRGLSEPKLFGSIIRGEDHFDSDIDLFVSAPVGSGLFPVAAFAAEVEQLTGFPTQVVAEHSATATALGRSLLRSAVPL